MERADGALLVLDHDQHAALDPARSIGAEAMDRFDRESHARHEVDPVNPTFEERTAAGQRLVVAPAAGALQLERVDSEVSHFPDLSARDHVAESSSQWLVGIVFRDKD